MGGAHLPLVACMRVALAGLLAWRTIMCVAELFAELRLLSGSSNAQLYLKTLFILFLSPLPPGGSREASGLPFSHGDLGFGPSPAQIRMETFCFYFGPKRS
jgi:hypothetical protein